MDDIGRVNIVRVRRDSKRVYAQIEAIESQNGIRTGVIYEGSLPLESLEGLEREEILARLRAAAIVQYENAQVEVVEPTELEGIIDTLSANPSELATVFSNVADLANEVLPEVRAEIEAEIPEIPPKLTPEELEQIEQNQAEYTANARQSIIAAAEQEVIQAQRELSAIENARKQPISAIPARARLFRARAAYIRSITGEV